jgi:hypothetical protein
METHILKTGSTTDKIVFLIACLGIVSVTLMDKLYWNDSILKEGWPNFSDRHIIQSIVIFISIIALFWSLVGKQRPSLELSLNFGIERLSIFATILLSVIILFLFIFQPSDFQELSKEDSILEWGSALLVFGSCFIMLYSLIKNSHGITNSKLIRFSLGFLSFCFFVMAMEEVSWFQRVIEIETPTSFQDNYQNEINLHNFATDYIENIYYFATFVFLVVFPLLRFLFPFLSNNNFLKTFIPRPFIGVIGAVACAYNFDMWNIIFTQITFYSSLVILCIFAIFSSVRNERFLIWSTVILMVTSQILFLVNGEKFDRIWELTEYKEFLIALALFIYSWDVFLHIKQAYLLKEVELKHVL